MTVNHLKKRRDDWKCLVDYETFWILTFSAVVLSSGIFALFPFPRTTLTHSRDMELPRR
jgi:hypothetical protein